MLSSRGSLHRGQHFNSKFLDVAGMILLFLEMLVRIPLYMNPKANSRNMLTRKAYLLLLCIATVNGGKCLLLFVS